ncbi:MAG: hypothetical protein WBD91_13010 [Acidobacteriaceae bacterium]
MIVAAWVCYYSTPVTLSKGRRIPFGCGLVAGVIGSILLISFLIVSFADPSHVGHVNVWDGRLMMSGFLVAFVSLSLALTGKGVPRLLSALSSIALLVLLYIGGLATSI